MQRVLITDVSRPVAEQIAKQLVKDFSVEICCDGRSVLRKIRAFEPDILLLDMSLPYYDGASILHCLQTSGFTGKIIIVSPNFDPVVTQLMKKYRIVYGITKPYMPANAVCLIRQMAINLADLSEWCVETEIDNILIRLGFQIGRSRYHCVYTAILMLYNGYEGDVTNCLYSEVRKACGKSTKDAVEKAIRDAIDHAWAHGDPAIWELYFPPGKENKCPSNEIFIKRIVRALNNHKRLKKPCKLIIASEKEA